MARDGAQGGSGLRLGLVFAAVLLVLGLAAWLALFGAGARVAHVAVNAPAVRPLPAPPMPHTPPLPLPRPPS
jgi:hypothetical protein